MRVAEPPAGFTQFSIDDVRLVCADHVAGAMRDALGHGTLYRYAERHPEARPLAGRGMAYAVPLPHGLEVVVVRHNRHGGLLAGVTGDVFRAPTRAPYELHASEELRARGVPVPVFLGYATYRAGPGFRRADVVTREVPGSFDLSVALLSDDPATRTEALTAAARAVALLSEARGHHEDLNIKNVLLHRDRNGQLHALILDVDRVRFLPDAPILERNVARFLRSARKWRRRYGARVSDAELAEFERAVRAAPRSPTTRS